MVLCVIGCRDREQRGDRPALDDLEAIVGPGTIRCPGDAPKCASTRRPSCASAHDLRHPSVRAGPAARPRSSARCVPPAGEAWMASCLVPTALATTSPSRTLYTSGLTRPETRASPRPKLASTETTFRLDVTGSAVKRMPAACGNDHPLHDDGHLGPPVVEAVMQAVGHGSLGEERGPAPADVEQDRRRTHDVQVRVVLARERCRRQVLRCRAGSDGVGGLLPESGPARARDRRPQILRDGGRFEGLADAPR